MIEKFYWQRKANVQERSRRLFDFKLILRPLSALYYADNNANTVAILPIIGTIADCPTLKLPTVTVQLPRTPSGNLK